MNEESNKMHLNFDTLAALIPWIEERQDLFSFISTCSALYRVGVPALLGFPCRITQTNLAAFHSFLLSKGPSSFLWIRDLALYCYVRPDEVEMVRDILNRARNIERLTSDGGMLDQDPKEYRVLATMQALRHLELDFCRDSMSEVLAALAELHAPIRHLMIKFCSEKVDVLAALATFCHTLEYAAISDVSLLKPTQSDLRYTNLTSLSLVSVKNMKLSILAPAFPNLTELQVMLDIDGQAVEQMRTDNERFQRKHPEQSWRLESLTGDAASLYALSFQNMVHNVKILCLEEFDEGDADQVGMALTPLRPLTLSMDDLNEPIYEMPWLSQVLADGWYELVRLDLELTLHNMDSIDEHQEQLDTLFEQLAVAASSKPLLAFLCICLPVEPQLGVFIPGEPSPAENFANNLHKRELAVRAQIAIPTLQVFKFRTWSFTGQDKRTFWSYEDNEIVEVAFESHDIMEGMLDEKTEYLVDGFLVEREMVTGGPAAVDVAFVPLTDHLLGIRDLTLADTWDPSEMRKDEAYMVKDILNGAKKTKRLAVDDAMLKHIPTAWRALATMQALHYLSLQLGPDTMKELLAALAELHAPLCKIKVRRSRSAAQGHGIPMDIVAAFANFCHTLVEAIIIEISPRRTTPGDFRYTNVTRLYLSLVDNVLLSVFVPAFPNLKCLELDWITADPAENEQFQREHPEHSWRLETLIGEAQSLYNLALESMVPTVKISCEEPFSPDEVELLRDAVAPLRPRKLIVADFNCLIHELDWLSEVLVEGRYELMRLDVELSLYDITTTEDPDIHEEQLDSLFEQLAIVASSKPWLSLLYIHLTVRFHRYGKPEVFPADAFVDSLDRREIATRAQLAIPNLQILCFKTWSLTTNVRDSWSYWAYENDDIVEVPFESCKAMESVFDEKTKEMITGTFV
ncbi:hypothetical protein EIP86_003663 [Pleurotus ostreatoroseus]|nr:hypothetical protein EIP86_003663 [Pleurotus ostreatoroseus]